jgi:hypothetical protein
MAEPTVTCPAEEAIRIIGGNWNLPVLLTGSAGRYDLTKLGKGLAPAFKKLLTREDGNLRSNTELWKPSQRPGFRYPKLGICRAGGSDECRSVVTGTSSLDAPSPSRQDGPVAQESRVPSEKLDPLSKARYRPRLEDGDAHAYSMISIGGFAKCS